jgi:hypothetical protein
MPLSFQMSCRTCRISTWIWSSTSLWQRLDGMKIRNGFF